MHLKTVNKNKKAQSVHSTGGKKIQREKKKNKRKIYATSKNFKKGFECMLKG